MNVAFIPVRGGSKSIPLKNIKLINNKPLVYWTIKAAYQCKYIDKVYVATDSEIIKNTINQLKIKSNDIEFEKVEVIERSEESATDTASTEFAMLEFADKYDFDNIVLIQATSPLLNADYLNGGFEVFNQKNTDSVMSVVRQKRFNWQYTDNGNIEPTNYDVYNRPRRQEFNGYLVENGAFYITSKKNLIKYKNRVSGNIKAYEMPEDTYYEIDEPSDWNIIENLMKVRNIHDKIEKNTIKMFLTDCDGCMTDGGMYYSESGDELKKFNTKDGMAFKLLKEKGIITGIITGEDVKLNKRRAEKINADILVSGCTDKLQEVNKICKEYNIDMKHIIYVGDDINDLELLKNVGISCCPNNAVEAVRNIVTYISDKRGGDGVIRDVVEFYMGDFCNE